MRADGTAANKAAAVDGDPAVVAECMNVSVHNGETFSAGDVIMLADTGGDYGGTLTISSSGTSGSKIIYEAYSGDTPYFDGAGLVTTWTAEGTANIWEAAYTTGAPTSLWVDGTLGVYKAGVGSLATNKDWYIDDGANLVYLYDDTNDPDTYSSPGVEVTIVSAGIEVAADHITVDGLTGGRHTSATFRGKLAIGDGVTFKNCIASYCGQSGFLFGDATGDPYNDLIIEDCESSYNLNHGFTVNYKCVNPIIRRNSAHNNGYTAEGAFMAGIKSYDDTDIAEGINIYENESYSNGYDDGAAKQGDGAGIWFDYTQSAPANPSKIHHNYVHDNVGTGIFIEISSNNRVYGNLLHDNAANAGQASGTNLGCGITVDTRYDFISENNHVYNNTVIGGRGGIKVASYSTGACELNNNIVKNNICISQTRNALVCDTGGDNDASGTGNVYESNCFGAESAGFINWGGVEYDTYDAYISASSQTDNNIEADPSFTNEGGDDYTLASDSPCIGAGVNLGAPYNEALMPSSSWPDAVVTGDQNDY